MSVIKPILIVFPAAEAKLAQLAVSNSEQTKIIALDSLLFIAFVSVYFLVMRVIYLLLASSLPDLLCGPVSFTMLNTCPRSGCCCRRHSHREGQQRPA